MNPGLHAFIDFSRWFAAFLVVISHVRTLIFIDFNQLHQKNILLKTFYFLTGFGLEAVVIFFVISGFLVGGMTLERWRRDGVRMQHYMTARFSRIYAVLLPALLCGLALDYIGLHWFNQSELYSNSAKYHMGLLHITISDNMNLAAFLGNLLMLQTIFTGVLGSNEALWSLSNEWWYYCLFALIAGGFLVNDVRQRWLYCCMALLVIVFLPLKILLWGLIWLLGILAHGWISSSRRLPAMPLAMVTFAIIIIAVKLSRGAGWPAGMVSERVRGLVLGLGYVIMLAGVARASTALPFASLQNTLARFSYSTYLMHYPLMVLTCAIGAQVFGIPFQVQPDAHGFAQLFGVLFIVYALCYLFSLLTERHTPLLRMALDRLLPARIAIKAL